VSLASLDNNRLVFQMRPHFFRSVRSDGQEVIRHPPTASHSISVHGRWQIAAIGWFFITKCFTSGTACGMSEVRPGSLPHRAK
jgi:hypothetical protein